MGFAHSFLSYSFTLPRPILFYFYHMILCHLWLAWKLLRWLLLLKRCTVLLTYSYLGIAYSFIYWILPCLSSGSTGFFRNSTAPTTTQIPSKGFPVFQDKENNPAGLKETHEWKSVPRRAVDNRENDKKPGIWTTAKVNSFFLNIFF